MNRPKRRRKKDNPYYLNTDGITYFINFIDNNGVNHNINVSKEIFDLFNEFELKDLSELNEYDNHIEHSEIYEYNLPNRIFYKPESLEDTVIRKIEREKLKQEINELPEIQKRRLKLYYFCDMTLEEIAKIENCSIPAVKYSIDIAIQKISNKFKN